MEFDFTTLNTGGGVHPFVAEQGVTDPRIISFSVAEMRLNLAPAITEGMHRCVDIGCFGYAPPEKERYDKAVVQWMRQRHNWDVEMSQCIQTTGVVTAMGMAIRALTQPGDGVIVQTPVYPPFSNSVKNNGRKLIENPLKCENGVYTMDFEDLDKKAADAKLLMLCSPHNPVGRVWTRDELKTLGEICRKHNLYVLSDEIHFDLDYDHRHTVFSLAAPELADRSIICTAPSKTFNLAGLQTSNIFIPGEAARKAFLEELDRFHYSGVNRLGAIACQAAYEGGQEWLTECKAYLLENLDYVREFLEEKLPGVKLIEPEGTYFAWLDFGAWGLNEAELDEFLIREAKVWLNSGSRFHAPLYQRVVLACPRATLKEAMERMAKAAEKRGF